MRVAGYIRVSSEEQKKNESPKIQKELIENYCQLNNYELIKIYDDCGLSGMISNRPALMQCLNDAQSHKFDELCVYSISRFGRDLSDTISNILLLKSLNINFRSFKEEFNIFSPIGKVVIALLASFADLERESMLARMKDGRDSKRNKKEIFVGRVPFGYIWNKETKKFEISKKDSQLYLSLVEMYLSGKTLDDICLYLRQNKIFKEIVLKDGKIKKQYLTSSSILSMFRNTAYYGVFIGNQHIYKNRQRTGERKDEKEFILYDLPALITKAKWDEIQEKRLFNKKKNKKINNTFDMFLRDNCICGNCGGKIIAVNNKGYKYYTCFWRHTSKKKCSIHNKEKCTMPLIPQSELESRVLSEIIEMLSLRRYKKDGKSYHEKPILNHLLQLDIEKLIENVSSELFRLKTEASKISRKKERLNQLLADEDFDFSHFKLSYSECNQEEKEIENLIKLKSDELNSQLQISKNAQDVIEFLQKTNIEEIIKHDVKHMDSPTLKLFVENIIKGKIVCIQLKLNPEIVVTRRLFLNLNPECIQTFLPSILNTDALLSEALGPGRPLLPGLSAALSPGRGRPPAAGPGVGL